MMRSSIFITILFVVLLVDNVSAQETENRHLLDIKYSECPESSTALMIAWSNDKYADWDKELNRYYNLLMDMLKADEKVKLRDAQLKWIAFRDAEFQFSATVNHNKGGTMYGVIHANKKAEFVRQRALELQAYYDTETMH